MTRCANTFTAKGDQVGYGQRGLFNIYVAVKKTLYITLFFLIDMGIKTITFPISDELHTRFKQYCIDKDVTMKDALVLAIQIVLQNHKGKK